jgi:hypothetical protein
MTTPANTNANAAAGHRVGGQEGRLAVTLVCKTAITLAITKKLTLSLLDSSDDADTDAYAALVPARSVIITAVAEISYAAGDEIVSMMIPRGVDKWVIPNIATDDADVEGTIDVFVEYLAN